MIDFLSQYWKQLLEVFALVLSVVFMLIRKKPVKVVDTLREVIVRVLPALINQAELQPGIKGEDKLAYVIAALTSILHDLNYGDEVIDQYLPFAKEQVELILSTPQKKGVK